MPPFALTVNVVSGGGTVTVDGSPITSNPAKYTYDTETQVKLEAVPAPGYRFVRWSGTGIASEANTITVDVNCDTDIQAGFNPIGLVLTIEKHGGGSIVPGPGRYNLPAGSVIPLKAYPAKGWKFDGWTSNVDNPSSPETSLTVNSDTVVIARFSLIWSIWMILGIIIGALIIAGGIFWFVVKHRKKVKNNTLLM